MNIKSRLKRKYGNNAVTEIMGTLMLLAIAVGLFSVIYFFVFTIEVTDQPPSANIIGYVDVDKAYFEHWGGSPINISGITISLNIDGVEQGKKNPSTDSDFSILNENPEGKTNLWEIGEILVFYDSATPDLLNNTFVSVKIIDVVTNSYLMSGILQRNLINNRPTASDNTVTTTENSDYPFKLSDFDSSFDDPDTGDKLEYIKIDDISLPLGGDLQLYGVPVAIDDEILRSEITGNDFKFVPDPNEVGVPGNSFIYGSFDFYVSDGEILSLSSYTMTIKVVPDNDPPILVVNSERPLNGTNDVAIDLTWNITIEDPDGDAMDWWINCSHSETASGTNNNGSRSLAISGLEFSTEYIVSVEVYDLYWHTEGWYTFTTQGTTIPGKPTFQQASKSKSWINLTWIKGTNADKTYIEMYNTPTWNRGDWPDLYNDTGTYFNHTTLTGCTTNYYYQAWSYNETHNTWSTTYDEYNTITNNQPTSAASSIILPKNDQYTFDLTDFPFSDIDAGDQLETIKVVILPSNGQLLLGVNPIAQDDEISLADIIANNFIYESSSNADTYTFDFQVGDGCEYSNTYVMTITVTIN